MIIIKMGKRNRNNKIWGKGKIWREMNKMIIMGLSTMRYSVGLRFKRIVRTYQVIKNKKSQNQSKLRLNK